MRVIDLNNEYLPIEDKELYEKMQMHFVSDKEKEFFDEMICKELYDSPVSTFDVFVHEDNNEEKLFTSGDFRFTYKNEEKLFIQKMYNTEYEIGIYSDENNTYKTMDYVPLCLAELVVTDLFPLLGRHITVLEWLREKNYECVRYDYPWEE